jgi:hypothetical protein
MLCAWSAPAKAFVSAGFRGGALHSNAASSGIVATLRPIGKLGLALSYNYASLDLDSNVEREMSSYNVLTGKSDADVTKATLRRYYTEAQVRYYPMSGSFFFAFGAISGTAAGTIAATERSSGASFNKSYSAKTLLGSFSLGNIWEFTGFMIGAEWVGFTRKISASITTTDNSGSASGGVLADADGEYSQLFETFAASGGASALIIHVGIAL